MKLFAVRFSDGLSFSWLRSSSLSGALIATDALLSLRAERHCLGLALTAATAESHIEFMLSQLSTDSRSSVYRESEAFSRSSFRAFVTNPTSPNHALQRTAPCVTAPASAATFPPAMQVPRRTPRSLSLGSLGVARVS